MYERSAAPGEGDTGLQTTRQRVLETGASLGIGAAVSRLLAVRGAALALHHAESVDL